MHLSQTLVPRREIHPEKDGTVIGVVFWQVKQGQYLQVIGRTLDNVMEPRYLGVQEHSSLKVATQGDRVLKRAFGNLVFFNPNIYTGWDIILQHVDAVLVIQI